MHKGVDILVDKLRVAYDDEERLESLYRYSILDSGQEPAYQSLAVMLRDACKMDWSAVTFVDRDRQWFKAQDGFDIPETPRDVSFCSIAMHSSQPLLVPDATCDARFQDNGLVTGASHLRSYFGMPIHSEDGMSLGSVCVIATHKPRQLPPRGVHLLTCARDWVHASLGQRRCLLEIRDTVNASASRQRSLLQRRFYFEERMRHTWAAVEIANRQCLAKS